MQGAFEAHRLPRAIANTRAPDNDGAAPLRLAVTPPMASEVLGFVGFGEGAAVRLGAAARVGVDDDVGGREGAPARGSRPPRPPGGPPPASASGSRSACIWMWTIGPGGAGAQLVHVGDRAGPQSPGRRSGRAPRRAVRGPSAGRRPRGTRAIAPQSSTAATARPPTASMPADAQPGRCRDADQGDEVGGQVGGVVRPVAGHGHRLRLPQHPALGRDQAARSARSRPPSRQAPSLVRQMGLGAMQVRRSPPGRSGRRRRTPGRPAPGWRTPRPCRGHSGARRPAVRRRSARRRRWRGRR